MDYFKVVKQFWQERKSQRIYEYLNTVNHPHRKLITDELKKFEPFKSLLEIGCGAGANLVNIHKEFPNVCLAGIDINHIAILKAQEQLPDVILIEASVENIPFADKVFDVVLSSALLIYIDIGRIKQVIEEMIRVCRKGFILIELEGMSRVGELEGDYWCRDYKRLLEDYKVEVYKQKIPKEIWDTPPWEKNGFIYVCHLPSPTLEKN